MEQSQGLLENILNNVSSLWVFGYGSILWKTGFEYERKEIGYITGFARRFWQGSTSHRGTPQKPGRVATLVPAEKDYKVWGAAYELVGKDMIVSALDHLGVRECLLGGYISLMTPFQARSSSDAAASSVLLFTATKDNSLFLGPASLDALAAQIISCRGPCGHNVQYVTHLATYMREHIPEETDEHLYGLVSRIEAQVKEQGLDIATLINEKHSHNVAVNSVCAKCNSLCSEYAFCSSCRADTIKDALSHTETTNTNAPTKRERRASHRSELLDTAQRKEITVSAQ